MRTTIKMLSISIVLLSFALNTTAQSELTAAIDDQEMEVGPGNDHPQKQATFQVRDEAVDNEEKAIRMVLLDYIEGTANGEPERIKRAFHQDLNLYSVANDALKVLPGQEYISYFKSGEKKDRIGKIIFIDYVNDAATAKIEVKMPGSKRLYTDYLLLLKTEDTWKIIHKSFTFEPMED